VLGLVPLLAEVSSKVYLVLTKFFTEALTLDSDRDAATRIRELLPGYKIEPAVLKQVEKVYSDQGVVFNRDGNCFYTNTDSDKSIALCRLYAAKTRDVLPADKQLYFAACRRENCLFTMLVDFREKISPIPVLVYEDSGKVIVKTSSAWENVIKNMLESFGYRYRVRTPGVLEVEAEFEDVVRDLVRGLAALGLVLKRKPSAVEYELDKAKIHHELKI
jgi:hypothetical protein